MANVIGKRKESMFDAVCTQGPQLSIEHDVLHDFGFFGHYLHVHAGGRSGMRHILTRLLCAGGRLSQREIQEVSGVSSAALSETLGKLEARGLVEKTVSEDDARQRDIALTSAGKARAEEFLKEKRAFEQTCLAPLTGEERQQLLDMLDRVVSHWKRLEEEMPANVEERGM
jgi:DNA-binding MarR family transcriptional regulator